jgi:anti-sigma B factor antagonist
MQFEVSREGPVVVVEPMEARLDAQHAIEFRDAMLRLVDAGEHQLVLDLTHVELVDSSGLGVLVAVLKRLGSRGVLVVCGARPPVASLFRLTRLDRVIKLFATRHKAVAAAEER